MSGIRRQESRFNNACLACRRTAPVIEDLKDQGYEHFIKKTTGLIPDAYFSGTKIKWILDHVMGAHERAKKGELLFGTIDTWLIWNLSGGKIHVTDYTNASRTMLFDIHSLCWNEKLLEVLDIPMAMMPGSEAIQLSLRLYGSADNGGCHCPCGSSRRSAGCTVWPMLF